MGRWYRGRTKSLTQGLNRGEGALIWGNGSCICPQSLTQGPWPRSTNPDPEPNRWDYLPKDRLELTVDGGRCSDNTSRIVARQSSKGGKKWFQGRIPVATFMDGESLLGIPSLFESVGISAPHKKNTHLSFQTLSKRTRMKPVSWPWRLTWKLLNFNFSTLKINPDIFATDWSVPIHPHVLDYCLRGNIGILRKPPFLPPATEKFPPKYSVNNLSLLWAVIKCWFQETLHSADITKRRFLFWVILFRRENGRSPREEKIWPSKDGR